jgi:hypothetical protein
MMEIQHAAEEGGLSFDAKIGRGNIAIKFSDGKKSKITVDPDKQIEFAAPSVDGKIMFLQIKKTGEQRFYDTQTGKQVQPKKGFNPKFYM